MKEDKWCKKVVCACTHEWPGMVITRFSDKATICIKCKYWPWMFKEPKHYKKYKKRAQV